MSGKVHQRKKVTFAWNADDVAKILTSHVRCRMAERYKYIDLPLIELRVGSFDKIMIGGKLVGLSMFTGYSFNERNDAVARLVEHDVQIGTEVTLVWGEEERRHQEEPPSSATSRPN